MSRGRICPRKCHIRNKKQQLVKIPHNIFYLFGHKSETQPFLMNAVGPIKQMTNYGKSFSSHPKKKLNRTARLQLLVIWLNTKSDTAVTCCSGENAKLMAEYNMHSVCPKGWTHNFVSDEKALFSFVSSNAMHFGWHFCILKRGAAF